MSEEVKYQLIRSFGPSVFKIQIPKTIINKLNEYIDNLNYIKSLIEKSQSDLLFDELSKINLIRKVLSGIKIK